MMHLNGRVKMRGVPTRSQSGACSRDCQDVKKGLMTLRSFTRVPLKRITATAQLRGGDDHAVPPGELKPALHLPGKLEQRPVFRARIPFRELADQVASPRNRSRTRHVAGKIGVNLPQNLKTDPAAPQRVVEACGSPDNGSGSLSL
jgi:hypothetical protein